MSMIIDIKKRALHRARILEGQMRGLQKKIENEDYCIDILTQSLAIQKSLGSLNRLIIENHLKTHIKDLYASGDNTKIEIADTELLKIFELYANRGK